MASRERPKDEDRDLKGAEYTLKVEKNNGIVHIQRVLRCDLYMVPKENYRVLRGFFQFVKSEDEQQVVMQPDLQRPAIEVTMKVIRAAVIGWMVSMFYVAFASSASADAPAWMHAAATAPLPAHDEKTDAVLIYAEDVTTVQPERKNQEFAETVFKILRPDGRWYGLVHAYFDSERRLQECAAGAFPSLEKTTR